MWCGRAQFCRGRRRSITARTHSGELRDRQDRLRARHPELTCRCTFGHHSPASGLGSTELHPREEFVLNRILDGAQILLPGDGQAVHQYIYRDHAAEALARAVDLPGEGFDVYNVASKRCNTSLEGFVDVCAEILGRPADTRTVGGGPTGEDRATFNNADCVFPFSNENTILAIDKAERAGLVSPFMDIREMIAAAYDALLAHPERRHWTRTDAEQRVLARLDTVEARS